MIIDKNQLPGNRLSLKNPEGPKRRKTSGDVVEASLPASVGFYI
ncbi:hypothetical protein [Synergistes jonesii]